MKKFLTTLFFILLIIANGETNNKSQPSRKVRISAFNYYPGIFQDENGQVKGFLVDIMDEIARLENWDVEYIYGSWNDGLQRIKNNEVDIISTVAYTDERSEYIDYPKTPIMTVWGEVYVAENARVNSPHDLTDKKVAVMKGDFNGQSFINLMNSFHLSFEIIELDNFDEVFDAVKENIVDAGVVNNTYGSSMQIKYSLQSTGIIFNPFDIYFAVAKGKNRDLLNTVDSYLTNWKQNKNSPFYKALKNWSYEEVNIISIIPNWFFIVLSVMVVGIFVSALFIFLLRRKVNQATIKIKEGEERYQLAMHAVNDGLFDWNMITGELYFSPGWKSMLGYEEHEIRNEFSEWQRLTKPEDVIKTEETLNNYLQGKSDKYEVEFQMKHKDGRWIDVLARGNAEFDETGKPIRFVGTHVDVTERKRVEEALKKRNEFVQTVLDNLPIGIALNLIDSGETIYVNRSFEEIYGWPASELKDVNNYFIKVYPDEEYRKSIISRVMSDIQSGDADKMHWENIKIITKTGEERIINAQNIPLFEQNTMVSTVIDITSQKQAEKAVIESQRLGAIGEMSSAIAHDFNNSLQAIIGNLELAMKKENVPDSIKKYLEIISLVTNDSAERVQQIQRFGGRKQTSSNYSAVDLNKIIADVVIQSRPLWKDNAEKTGLIITIERNLEEIPFITGNEGELRSVLFNIIKNSIEAMPEGGVIKISTKKGTEKAILIVSDTGIGMNEEARARLFQPFYSTKGFEAGRCLGMSGAYSIINEHGGALRIIESSAGNGTSLEIVLPFSGEETVDRMKEEVPEYKGTVKMLWVDDDKLIRDVAKEMIKCLGHEGDMAGSGEEALRLLEINSYDFVVTDIGMPGMSGWKLIEKIKEKFSEGMKIVLLTGWGSEISEKDKDRFGIFRVLSKPFKISQLEKLIAEAMREK